MTGCEVYIDVTVRSPWGSTVRIDSTVLRADVEDGQRVKLALEVLAAAETAAKGDQS